MSKVVDGRLHAVMADGTVFIVGGRPNCTAVAGGFVVAAAASSGSVSWWRVLWLSLLGFWVMLALFMTLHGPFKDPRVAAAKYSRLDRPRAGDA